MLSILKNIANLEKDPLHYVFETIALKQKPDTLWLEFGVFVGDTIMYFSKFTNGPVFGFDSFEGLPEDWIPGWEKGKFNLRGILPPVPAHVTLIKGWFNETVPDFIKTQK